MNKGIIYAPFQTVKGNFTRKIRKNLIFIGEIHICMGFMQDSLGSLKIPAYEGDALFLLQNF